MATLDELRSNPVEFLGLCPSAAEDDFHVDWFKRPIKHLTVTSRKGVPAMLLDDPNEPSTPEQKAAFDQLLRMDTLAPSEWRELYTNKFVPPARDVYTPPPSQRRVYVFTRDHRNIGVFCEQYHVDPSTVTYLDRVERVRGLRRVEVVFFAIDDGSRLFNFPVYDELYRLYEDGRIGIKYLPWRTME